MHSQKQQEPNDHSEEANVARNTFVDKPRRKNLPNHQMSTMNCAAEH